VEEQVTARRKDSSLLAMISGALPLRKYAFRASIVFKSIYAKQEGSHQGRNPDFAALSRNTDILSNAGPKTYQSLAALGHKRLRLSRTSGYQFVIPVLISKLAANLS
jgi:hypothetical protein